MPGGCFRLHRVDQGSPVAIRDAEMLLNAMRCAVHWRTGSSLLPLDVRIDFLSPRAASNLGLPACKTCCPHSSHAHLESCTSDVSITRKHQASRPGPRKKEACHDHRMPHPKVFGPRMVQTKCTSLDVKTSHGGAADQKALPLVARRSMEANVA